MIYGNDDSRSGWFDTDDIKHTSELIVNRHELPISATMLRTLMALNLRKIWMQFVDPKLHKMYDELRNEMMTVPYYQNLENELKKILILNDKEAWDKIVDPLLSNMYEEIRKTI